ADGNGRRAAAGARAVPAQHLPLAVAQPGPLRAGRREPGGPLDDPLALGQDPGTDRPGRRPTRPDLRGGRGPRGGTDRRARPGAAALRILTTGSTGSTGKDKEEVRFASFFSPWSPCSPW